MQGGAGERASSCTAPASPVLLLSVTRCALGPNKRLMRLAGLDDCDPADAPCSGLGPGLGGCAAQKPLSDGLVGDASPAPAEAASACVGPGEGWMVESQGGASGAGDTRE